MSMKQVYQNFTIIAFQKTCSDILDRVKSFTRSLRPALYVFCCFILLISYSCNRGNKKELPESPTRGNIKISVDESFQPLIDSEVYTFTSLYIDAKIKAEYKPEYDVVNDFMNDSVKTMVTSRKLTDDQIQYLRDTLVIARTVTFAYDALALITNKENPDTLLTFSEVENIFKGKATRWDDIDSRSKLGAINVIFDSNKSGNIRYFRERFNLNDTLGSNFFAVNSNSEVIDFVSRNPQALGIVSVNWISDRDDSLSMSFINKINIIAVSQQYINDGSYYRPVQGSIYDKSYPFVREVYFTTRETFKGLGSGFLQWATAEQGQRIVLKSGLVPATMPIRLVQIKK